MFGPRAKLRTAMHFCNALVLVTVVFRAVTQLEVKVYSGAITLTAVLIASSTTALFWMGLLRQRINESSDNSVSVSEAVGNLFKDIYLDLPYVVKINPSRKYIEARILRTIPGIVKPVSTPRALHLVLSSGLASYGINLLIVGSTAFVLIGEIPSVVAIFGDGWPIRAIVFWAVSSLLTSAIALRIVLTATRDFK